MCPMANKTASRPDFHSTVELELRRRDWGIRTLAKRLAGDGATHEQIEVERKAVRRWLKGAVPSQANRRRVAVALDLPQELFDDDAEEEDSLSSILQREVELATARATRRWEQLQRDRAEVRA